MSLLTASLAIVLFFGFAVAEISAPSCSSTWEWSFNSLGQDPCTIAAYMLSTCNGGSFTLGPLQPGYSYAGPDEIDDSNLCECSTVGYSLISACGGCQGEEWITWSEFSYNCTMTLPPSLFPSPIPSGIRVPQWALLDISNENNWNFNKSYTTGGSPELGPGTILGPSAPPVSGSSASNNATSGNATSSRAAAGGRSSNAGAIAGGIAGGIAAISILVAALLFYQRRRRSQVMPASFVVDDSVSNPHMSQVMSGQETPATSLPEKSSSPKPYNPDDPTTFPFGYQGVPNLPYIPARVHSFSSSKTPSLYTTATVPNSKPQGYHGRPIV